MNSFIKICGLVASLQFFGIQGLEAAALYIDPGTQSVMSGEFVSLDVNVGGLSDDPTDTDYHRVGTYDLNLSYDPLLLDFESLTFGTELGYDFDSYVFFDDTTPAVIEVLEVSFLDLNDLLNNQPTDFTLFSVTFKTKGSGTALLDLAGNIAGDPNSFLGDEWGESLVVNIQNSLLAASIDIQARPDGNIPEPSSLLLLGLGLPILFRRLGNISA